MFTILVVIYKVGIHIFKVNSFGSFCTFVRALIEIPTLYFIGLSTTLKLCNASSVVPRTCRPQNMVIPHFHVTKPRARNTPKSEKVN